jgi:hypothetical protein
MQELLEKIAQLETLNMNLVDFILGSQAPEMDKDDFDTYIKWRIQNGLST